MRNDKERMEFVKDDANWHRVGVDIMGKVRLRELEYKDHFWYRIEILMHGFDTEWLGTEMKRTKKVEWQPIRMYVLDKDTRAFEDTISPTQIVDQIKEIDKQERKEKNNG